MRRALAVGLVALVVPAAAQATPTIRASIAPTTVHVGDPFRYTVVARVPGRAGASLRVVADSGAFVQISGPAVSRTSDAGATVVTVTETLVCLDLGCVSGATARHVVLPAPQVFTGSTRVGGPHTTVTVTPRVTAHAVAAGRAAYQRDTSAPTLTPRLRLAVAATIAIALAVALVGAAVALVLAEVRRRKAPEPNVRRSPFDLGIAVRLLRESAKRPEPDRRRAADLVARLASPEVVDEATRVAWARPAPGPADVESLAADVERTSGTTHR